MKLSRLQVVRRRIGTVLMDLRYGAILKGRIESRYEHLGAVLTDNTGYDVLPILFSDLVTEKDVLVDVGCGKGRVINWWLSVYPGNRLYGIELDDVIAERTRRRLKKYKNVAILTGDACDLIPREATMFYLYNPFRSEVMERFMAELVKHPRSSEGAIRRLVCFHFTYERLFENNRNFEVMKRLTIDRRPPIQCAVIRTVDRSV